MNKSNLKNMLVLKNLPSNIVEEAIIILKTNTKIKKLEKIENNKKSENISNKKAENDYILKEAEMLVNSYISKIEEKKDFQTKKEQKARKKYKQIKTYAYISTIIIFVETLAIIIK